MASSKQTSVGGGGSTQITGLQKALHHVRWEHLAAGVTGGVMSTVILHPLDLVKIRFQVNEGVTMGAKRPQYHGVFDAFVTIGKNEGVRGLYRGITPNVWGTGASWGLYFLFYNAAKTWMLDYQGVNSLGAGSNMLSAAEAGVLTLMMTNPLWVAKTRLCLQYDHQPSQTVVHYRGLWDCLAKVYHYEGVRGLYKGLVPGIFGVSHGALQFMAYEELKKLYNRWREAPVNTKFNSLEYLTFAAISKIFAATLTYPYQVVRSRLQDQHRQYKGALDVIMLTWRDEGARAFCKGITPALIRVVPACCITFVVYENVIAYLMPEK